MTSPRIAGLRGRLPVKPDGEKFAIGYVHEYLGQPLPVPVYPVDVSGGITEWLMMGNGPDPSVPDHPDGVGDCTFCGRFHLDMATAAAGGEPMPTETAEQLVAEYLQYDHGQDEGANIADLLLYWYKNSTILAFAPVDHTDPAACDAAMQAFHGLYVGVDLTDDADQLFENGQTWTVANGEQPDPSEGHCIVKVASTGAGQFDNDTWVTWGALQRSTTEWTKAALGEAWVLITQEDADAASLDIAALRADIDALGGTGGGTPANGKHAPSAESLLVKLAAEIRNVAARSEPVAYLLQWLKKNGL